MLTVLSTNNFLKNYLAVLPVIYCHKGLDVTCFQGSAIHLGYLLIKIISKLVVLHYRLCYYYYHAQTTYLNENIMNSQGFKAYIISMFNVNCKRSRKIARCKFIACVGGKN